MLGIFLGIFAKKFIKRRDSVGIYISISHSARGGGATEFEV